MIDELSQITPHLFLSNWPSSENVELLKHDGIRAILTAETRSRTREVLNDYASLGISYRQIYIDDSPTENISLYFNPTYDFIEDHISKGQNVLVNCHAGVSRSATLVLNWIIRTWYKACPPLDPYESVLNALIFLRKKRPIVNPNLGFKKQLNMAAELYKESCQQHLKEKRNISNSQSSSMNPITARANPMMNNQMNSPGQMGSANPGNMAPRTGSNIQDVVSGSRPNGPDPNIIFLTNQDFDPQGNLVNFSGVNGVVWFFSHGCGHCQHMKSEYEKFAMLLANSPAIRALAIDTAKHRDLMARIKPEVFGFSVMGVPMVVGYNKGKFYSEYADDDRAKFRTAESLLQYAAGIGNAPIETAPSR
jgi:protein-tyrosine phosphatase/thiol-disulfide isomerase/thioredoxin